MTGGLFHKKDPIEQSVRFGTYSSGAGFLVASIQNALTKHNAGAAGVLTRFGSTFALFAVSGTAYGFVEAYAGNYRVVVGALAGIRFRSIPSALGLGLGLGATMALFEYSGGVMGDPLRSARTEQVTVEGDA
ncbi:hypothetical protein DL96DRAFT_1573418 [Flagelloscypha sp. PMI_526]|nr:hypothetical protein DL96DRAFT_1573418 [Flagelloscypha sp. PMI_526]